MNIPTAIFALIWVAAFIAVLAMAVMGLRATLRPTISTGPATRSTTARK